MQYFSSEITSSSSQNCRDGSRKFSVPSSGLFRLILIFARFARNCSSFQANYHFFRPICTKMQFVSSEITSSSSQNCRAGSRKFSVPSSELLRLILIFARFARNCSSFQADYHFFRSICTKLQYFSSEITSSSSQNCRSGSRKFSVPSSELLRLILIFARFARKCSSFQAKLLLLPLKIAVPVFVDFNVRAFNGEGVFGNVLCYR